MSFIRARRYPQVTGLGLVLYSMSCPHACIVLLCTLDVYYITINVF